MIGAKLRTEFERHGLVDVRVDREGRRISDQQRVAVRRLARNVTRRNVAAGAWLRFDNEILPERFGKSVGDQPSGGVDRASGRDGRYQRHHTVRVAFSEGCRGCQHRCLRHHRLKGGSAGKAAGTRADSRVARSSLHSWRFRLMFTPPQATRMPSDRNIAPPALGYIAATPVRIRRSNQPDVQPDADSPPGRFLRLHSPPGRDARSR